MDKYNLIFRQQRRNDQGEFLILFSKSEPLPWGIKTENAEHYFKSLHACVDFARDMGWIDDSERRLIFIILIPREVELVKMHNQGI